MFVQEYQAKEILNNFNIRIPSGKVAATPSEAFNIARNFSKPVVVKAQVLAGGRGKAGGVRVVQNPEQALAAAQEILGMQIKGHTVHKLLVEEALTIEKEFYLSFALDRSLDCHILMVSAMGGMDIEIVAQQQPHAILKLELHPIMGLQDYQVREAMDFLKIPAHGQKDFSNLTRRLWAAYNFHEATLMEINPLIFTDQDIFIAGDAKFNFDDNALPRREELLALSEAGEEDIWEKRARQQGLAFVRLDGNIGIIGNGAGLVMTTLDVVKAEKGKPANFLDLGGGAGAESMRKAVSFILSLPSIQGLFINIFGGITRCDEVANGIMDALQALSPKIPIVLRLAGTNADKGLQLLSASKLHTAATMQEGAQKIVRLVKDYSRNNPFD